MWIVTLLTACWTTRVYFSLDKTDFVVSTRFPVVMVPLLVYLIGCSLKWCNCAKTSILACLMQTFLCVFYFERLSFLAPFLHLISLLCLIHPHYPPSIPLHLLPTIIVHSSLICPHLPSLDSGVIVPPGHKFCMIVHLQASNSSLASPSHAHTPNQLFQSFLLH